MVKRIICIVPKEESLKCLDLDFIKKLLSEIGFNINEYIKVQQVREPKSIILTQEIINNEEEDNNE